MTFGTLVEGPGGAGGIGRLPFNEESISSAMSIVIGQP